MCAFLAGCLVVFEWFVVTVAYDKARQMRFCVICYTMAKTKRTKHCKLCEVCVTDMDHHCLYLLTCIGRHNHRLFIVFSALVLIAQVAANIFLSSRVKADMAERKNLNIISEPKKTERMKIFELSKFQLFSDKGFKTTLNIPIQLVSYSTLTSFLPSQESFTYQNVNEIKMSGKDGY